MALSNVDEVIELVKKAPSPAQAKRALMARAWGSDLVRGLLGQGPVAQYRPEGLSQEFGLKEEGYRLSEEQAQAIIEHRGNARAVPDDQRNGRGQGQVQPRPFEASPMFAERHAVGGARVIERGGAVEQERQSAAHDADAAHEVVGAGAAGTDGHVVLDLGDAVGVQEPRDQDVGVRPVELLAAEFLVGGRDPESPALAIVQDGREHAR